jgi:hypothetical protein
MQTVMKNIEDDRLKIYVVWLPMFPGDNREWAEKRSEEFSDERLTYFWDEEQITAQVWKSVLQISRAAWDVYFLYNDGVHWDEEPSLPDFWMHQLGGVNEAPFLNRELFEQKTRELLMNINEEGE